MKSKSKGQIILLAIMIAIAVISALPVLLVLMATFTDEVVLAQSGFSFFPEKFSVESWKFLGTLKKQIIRGYGVTIFITAFGTVSTLLIESLFAYVLSRKNFVFRTPLTVMMIITMLFDGGQLSRYIVNTQLYHLRDNLLVLCLPALGAMQVILMRSYIEQSISDSLIEAARIDGAGEPYIYWKICIPLMQPVLAALGFMKAVNIWNEWENALLYVSSKNKAPLQLILIRIEQNLDYMTSGLASVQEMMALEETIPATGARMAMLFTVLGPVMILYPFFQKYFVKGLTLGGVKG